jgi:hypothetical protein
VAVSDRRGTDFIALNYAPLLVHAVHLAKDGPSRERIASELRARPTLARRYGLLQLWILVPAAVVVMAVAQARRR